MYICYIICINWDYVPKKWLTWYDSFSENDMTPYMNDYLTRNRYDWNTLKNDVWCHKNQFNQQKIDISSILIPQLLMT